MDLVDAFTEIVHQWPDRPAIIHNGRVLSYSQLNASVRSTAVRLGPDPGVVGLFTERSPNVVVGLLGVLAAGGVYCPIDPAFPEERQRAMLAAAGVGLPVGAEAAYLLFTSGSTGAPKPVVTPRRAIAVAVRSLRELFGITPADRVLQFASLNWDTCFEEILPTLTAGAALVLDDEAYAGSLPRFLRTVERERITVLDLPTAFWHELVRHLSESRAELPGCLRLMVIGGEAVNPARLADWCALETGRIRLLNTYGCTETTLITHAVDLHGPQASPWARDGPVPIGRPLPHVLERLGDEGELLIGGPALAAGYHGRPEATESRFLVEGSGRWFRTGDRVARSPDGMLLHRGRLDHEVKVRGIRVDPAEVEAQISAHPGVGAVAVAGVTVADRTTLVAYVVPRPHTDSTTLDTDVLAHLRGRVPGHLIPGRITVVTELAYTASGKIDRAGSHQRYAQAARARVKESFDER